MSNPNSELNYSHTSATRDISNRAATSVTIRYEAGIFRHTSLINSAESRPKVVFTKDGLALGCTFISNDALDKLIEVYTDYKTGSRVIQ